MRQLPVHPLLLRNAISPRAVYEAQGKAEDRLRAIEDRQAPRGRKAAAYREEEIAELGGVLRPVRVDELEMPQLPMVRFIADGFRAESTFARHLGRTFVVLGEITQMPGHVVVMDIGSGEIVSAVHADELEMLVPDEA